MLRLVTACLVATAVALPATAALAPGQSAPYFALRASLAGKAFDFSLKESLKKGPVVVCFYPSAFTGGCNIQAHSFAVNHDKFKAAGASVIGVSLDNIKRLNDFSADPASCGGKVAVASDEDGKTARSYDLKVRDAVAGRKDTRGVDLDQGFAERQTFVVTPDGKVAATIGGVAPEANVLKALDVVRQLAAKKS